MSYSTNQLGISRQIGGDSDMLSKFVNLFEDESGFLT